VFSIHGNHDDPAGQGNFSSMDLLHSCGLINYFGKCLSLEAIELSPLQMQKGATRLALYGLGAVRDERLHRYIITFSLSHTFHFSCILELQLHYCMHLHMLMGSLM